MKNSSFFLYFLLCALAANAGTKNNHLTARDTMQHITLDTLEIDLKPTAPSYQPSNPRVWEITNTKVALSFNWKAKTADTREWIKMHPYFYQTDSIVLDAKGMRIDSIMLAAKTGNRALKYTYENNKLAIHFDHAYKQGDSVELYLKYTAMPYAKQSGGSAAITDDRGLYFINTDYKIPNKPSEIWTQGETEANSHWMITVDKPNTRFTTQIELTIPDSMTTLSNGALVKQIKGANGMRTDIWKMDMPIQAYATMFAIGKFSVIKDKWKNKEVNYYVEPEFAPYAKLMFNNTPEMIEYFSQRTGVAYPWNKYSQVVARDYVSGAMENTTASLFGEFMNQNAREIADKNSEDVVSHELFHQWFGDYVTCESWTNVTVNESFANYGEQLWRRHRYGDAAGDELAWNDLQLYLYSSQLKDPQLVRFNYDNKEEVFDAISYNKGGATLHYLNTLIGDAAFDRAMNIYLTKNALHSAEAHNWRMAVEEATGQDWNRFFNEWYYHAGHPALKVSYTYNDSANQLMVTVNQNQQDSTFGYTLPLKTAVIYGNERTITDWTINKRKDTFIYAYRNGVKPIIIPDYLHVLPGEIRENKKPIQWLAQYKNSDNYVSKRLAVAGAMKSMSDTNTHELVTLALNDNMTGIRRYTLSQMENVQSEKYRRKWNGKILAMAANETDRQTRAEAVGVLGEWKMAAAKSLLINAVTDSSYIVAGAALEALDRVDADTAYVLAKKMLGTNPRASLESAIWILIGKKGADGDLALYEQKAPFVQGPKKPSFAISMNSYLKHVKSDDSFEKLITLYTGITVNENMKSRRTMMGGFLFQVAADQKTNAKSDNKEDAAIAQKRLAIVKLALNKVVAAETDEDELKDYEKMMKELND